MAREHLQVDAIQPEPLALHLVLPLKPQRKLVALLELLWQIVETLDASAEWVIIAVVAVAVALLQCEVQEFLQENSGSIE